MMMMNRPSGSVIVSGNRLLIKTETPLRLVSYVTKKYERIVVIFIYDALSLISGFLAINLCLLVS